MSSALPKLLDDVDITGSVLSDEYWATGYAFCTYPAEAEEQTARFQFQGEHKHTELKGAQNSVEDTDGSVCRTTMGKRKAIETGDPKPRKTKKTNATVLETLELAALPKQIPPLASPTSRVDDQTLDQLSKHNINNETILPPPTEVDSSNKTCQSAASSVRLSPSGEGDNWLGLWADIVSTLPVNKRTEDNPRWVALLTKVLTHTFGYGGVNNVLQMAEQVYKNLDVLELDAITALDAAKDSPFRSAAISLKNVWARSRGDALMTVEAMVYYKELAEDFRRLEMDTYCPGTTIGQDWIEYSQGRTGSVQVRQNFVLQRLLEYISPSAVDKDKKKKDTAKLQKERLMARNIDLMVRLFGHGVLPLMGGSIWRETFPQYAAATAEPLLRDLLARCPILRQICDRADKNFYQYVRIRGKIVDLPEKCLRGCGISIDLRKEHTLAYLLTAPEELEASVDSMEEGNDRGEREQ
ncbi:hypothetical protein QM012_001313 [Aureobasidium pullulans]|uniref:Uncharacterized protein n=1 Tax=Aureobasidium pullulans TaxID=5580 RepID=A0ABR0TDP9_AURPU